jgi:arylsulfatase A-like enzyme
MIVCWPAKITDKGGLRSQFHHVIDIVPTLIDVAGVQAPDVLNGIPQQPIEGVSMTYTFGDANRGSQWGAKERC